MDKQTSELVTGQDTLAAAEDPGKYAKDNAALRAALREKIAQSVPGGGAASPPNSRTPLPGMRSRPRLTTAAILEEVSERLGKDFKVPDTDPTLVQVILGDVVLHEHVAQLSEALEECIAELTRAQETILHEAKEAAAAIVTNSAVYVTENIKKALRETLEQADKSAYAMRYKTLLAFRTLLAALGFGSFIGAFSMVLLYVFVIRHI